MEFIRSMEGFPFSSAVVHSGKVLETVITAVSYTHLTLPTTPYV